MVDLTEQETAAIATAIKPVAAVMQEIGWSTRFQDLTKEQVLRLISEAVGGFREAMGASASIDAAEPPF